MYTHTHTQTPPKNVALQSIWGRLDSERKHMAIFELRLRPYADRLKGMTAESMHPSQHSEPH